MIARKGGSMKALWIILGVVAVIVVAVAVVIFVGISKIDDMVIVAVERVGTNITGTTVTLDEADISLRSGEGALRGLHIANPAGYSDREAFNLEEISFRVNIESLREDVFRIDEIHVIGPVALVEMNEDGKSNFDVIQSNMNRHRGPEKEGEDSDYTDPKRMQVGLFHTEKGSVETDATAMGAGSSTVELPVIRLEELGGEAGFTGEELGNAILEALGDQVLQTAVEEELKRLVDENLKGEAGNAIKGLIDRFRN
jgi:hypothetical protein